MTFTTSATIQAVNVANTGDVSTSVFNPPAVSGPDATSFVIDSEGCSGHGLDAGTSCSISLRFLPDAGTSTSRAARLSVSTVDGLDSGVALTGTVP